jgi:FkbM family methyltransferase
VEQLVRVGDTCVDVGANFGMYSLLLASLVGPQGRVLAFEPSPPAFNRLSATCRAIPWIEARNIALGAAVDEATIVVARGDAMHSTMRRTAPPDGWLHQVAVEPLTHFIGPDQRIAFVKLDVEGFESQVLEGMWPLLVGSHVDALMLEAEPTYGDLAWVERLRTLEGYTMFSLTLTRQRARWHPSLTVLGADEAAAGTVFLIKLKHPRLSPIV